MARFGTGAAPAYLLLLLAFLPSRESQPGFRLGERDPDAYASADSKNNLKEIIKFLDQQIQVLHQRNLMHEHEITEKQSKTFTENMNLVKGSSVKEKASPSSLTAKERLFPNSNSVLMGNKVYKISPNILMDTPVRHNKVKGGGSEENGKEGALLPDLKQDKTAGNNGGRSLRTTNITVRFHSPDNSSETQIDIYNLKDSREVPEVHIVANNIINQGLKMDSVTLKDNGMQVIVNSSVDKKMKHIKGRRKTPIKLDGGITGESTPKSSKTNHPATDVPELFTYQMLVLNQILQSLRAQSAHTDNSQSTINEQTKISVKELENILNEQNKETDQEPLLSSDKMQSSVMKNILQELKKYTVQNTPPAVESKTQMLMEQSKESQGPERQSSDKEKALMESSSEEGLILPASSETSLIFSLKSTLPQSIRTEVTNEDVNDARRFEFFEKYEGIQDKKRAKAADLKQLLKHIIVACVAVSGLILAVIVLVHIYNSLFVKKQKPIIANANTDKKEESDKEKEFVKNKESDKHEESEKIEESETNNMIPLEPKTSAYNTIDIENHNNNNCSPPGIFLSTDGEDVTKPLEIQPVSSPSCPEKPTELMPYVESLEESPNYSTHKNFKLQSKPFKLNRTSYNSLEQYNTPRNQDYETYQEKDSTPHRKKTDHYLSSRSRPKSTQPKRAHTALLSKHQYYNSLNWVHDPSSDNFIAPNINKNFNESKMSQFDGTEYTCFQHQKYGSGTDSYSD
ncbi:uncharacterized protein LOC117666327 [Pantherophis guttatus]|uniref:Uncharacterized protein LOC117666327 n=1 Tax=Pantherophis guttatus TaxID=94885 RepID=A0A6P9C4V5_PANGU|nr:uncharacterized protein LOC117666327 [Pantherophis guttatus]